MPSSSGPSTHNRLLATLPSETYAQLEAQWEPIDLEVAEYLQTPGEAPSYVYFPTGAVIILVYQVDQRPPLAVGLVGLEGLVGVPVFLGADSARWGAQVHLAGTALRLPAEVLRQICQGQGPLPSLLHAYTDLLLSQVIQNAACGRFHALPARLARWLLMTADSSQASEMRLTHQTLAEWLGVRREAVSTAAGVLQRQRLIGYRRGVLRILDRSGLEPKACSCYQTMDTAAPAGKT